MHRFTEITQKSVRFLRKAPSIALLRHKHFNVTTHYLAPATPCDRLLAHDSVEPAIKEKRKAQFKGLDPVRLLQEMRTAQQTLTDFPAHRVRAEAAPAGESDVAGFLASFLRHGRKVRHVQRTGSNPKQSTAEEVAWIRSPTPGL